VTDAIMIGMRYIPAKRMWSQWSEGDRVPIAKCIAVITTVHATARKSCVF